MTLYEELKARGLVAQITDEEIIDLINNGKATFYIGFDCTADSLTAGHFLALTLMKRLQLAGNKPIALIGGGTTMIGDPSGRTDMRKDVYKRQGWGWCSRSWTMCWTLPAPRNSWANPSAVTAKTARPLLLLCMG